MDVMMDGAQQWFRLLRAQQNAQRENDAVDIGQSFSLQHQHFQPQGLQPLNRSWRLGHQYDIGLQGHDGLNIGVQTAAHGVDAFQSLGEIRVSVHTHQAFASFQSTDHL